MIPTLGGRFPRANVFDGTSNRSPTALANFCSKDRYKSGSSDSCFSRRTRKASTAIHRTQKIALYFQGVAACRSNHLICVLQVI